MSAGGSGEEEPTFSMKYLTNDDHYRIEHFKNDQKKLIRALVGFNTLMVNRSSSTWRHWYSLSKENGGIEHIPVKALRQALRTDENTNRYYLSVRFCGSEYRLIGFKKGSVFYVTGFDWDYTAYNHG